jgi:hypothetical protein
MPSEWSSLVVVDKLNVPSISSIYFASNNNNSLFDFSTQSSLPNLKIEEVERKEDVAAIAVSDTDSSECDSNNISLKEDESSIVDVTFLEKETEDFLPDSNFVNHTQKESVKENNAEANVFNDSMKTQETNEPSEIKNRDEKTAEKKYKSQDDSIEENESFESNFKNTTEKTINLANTEYIIEENESLVTLITSVEIVNLKEETKVLFTNDSIEENPETLKFIAITEIEIHESMENHSSNEFVSVNESNELIDNFKENYESLEALLNFIINLIEENYETLKVISVPEILENHSSNEIVSVKESNVSKDKFNEDYESLVALLSCMTISVEENHEELKVTATNKFTKMDIQASMGSRIDTIVPVEEPIVDDVKNGIEALVPENLTEKKLQENEVETRLFFTEPDNSVEENVPFESFISGANGEIVNLEEKLDIKVELIKVPDNSDKNESLEIGISNTHVEINSSPFVVFNDEELI